MFSSRTIYVLKLLQVGYFGPVRVRQNDVGLLPCNQGGPLGTYGMPVAAVELGFDGNRSQIGEIAPSHGEGMRGHHGRDRL
jgi:hypothetical protein